MLEEITSWRNSIIEHQASWEGNNLHIDEVSPLFTDRETWVLGGLCCFEMLLEIENNARSERLIPFLHFALTDSDVNLIPEPVTRASLNQIIDDFTPPSLNFCEKTYLNGFIEELKPCVVSKSDSEFNKFRFFYFRTYFDKRENAFSRELYVFNYIH